MYVFGTLAPKNVPNVPSVPSKPTFVSNMLNLTCYAGCFVPLCPLTAKWGARTVVITTTKAGGYFREPHYEMMNLGYDVNAINV